MCDSKEVFIKNKIQQYYKNKSKIKRQVNIYRQLGRDDIVYKIINNLSTRINEELKNKNIQRKLTYVEYLGCSPSEFKIYIEKKFTKGMSFNNYGEWEIDHIIPISKMNLRDTEEAKKCFNHTNLQPLWKLENRKKSNKINL